MSNCDLDRTYDVTIFTAYLVLSGVRLAYGWRTGGGNGYKTSHY